MRWTIKEAVRFVRLLHTALAPHYDVGLCGGVLYAGYSDKDVDVIVYPTQSPRFDRDEIARYLVGVGMTRTRTCIELHAGWREYGSRDTKWVEEWAYRGRRCDVFMLAGSPNCV